MRQEVKKSLKGFLALLIMVFGLMISAVHADAAEVSVGNLSDLKNALKIYNEKSIKLTSDIMVTLEKDSEESVFLVQGTKTLDLNGKAIYIINNGNVNDKKNIASEHVRTLFAVEKGSTFTVNDSVGSGFVHYSGYMIGTSERYCGICERDLFDVQGTLILNKGNFAAGSSKDQWVSCLLYVGEGGMHSGYAQQQIWGKVAKVGSSGKLVINGGSYISYGMKRTDPPLGEYKDIRNSIVRVEKGGKAFINNGTFEAHGGADVFSNAGTLKVAAGTFQTHKYDKIRHPNDFVDGSDYVLKGSYGSATIPTSQLVEGGRFSRIVVSDHYTKVEPIKTDEAPKDLMKVSLLDKKDPKGRRVLCENYSTDEVYWDWKDTNLRVSMSFPTYYGGTDAISNYNCRQRLIIYVTDAKGTSKKLIDAFDVKDSVIELDELGIDWVKSKHWLLEMKQEEIGPDTISNMKSAPLLIHTTDDYNQVDDLPKGYTNIKTLLSYKGSTPDVSSLDYVSGDYVIDFTYWNLPEGIANEGYSIQPETVLYKNGIWNRSGYRSEYNLRDSVYDGLYVLKQSLILKKGPAPIAWLDCKKIDIKGGSGGLVRIDDVRIKGNLDSTGVKATLPKAGCRPSVDFYGATQSETLSKYSGFIDKSKTTIKWQVGGTHGWNDMDISTDKFESGKNYRFQYQMTAADGFYFDKDNPPLVKIYGKDADAVIIDATQKTCTVTQINKCYPTIYVKKSGYANPLALGNYDYLIAGYETSYVLTAESSVPPVYDGRGYMMYHDGALKLKNYFLNDQYIYTSENFDLTVHLQGDTQVKNESAVHKSLGKFAIVHEGNLAIEGDGGLALISDTGILTGKDSKVTINSGELTITANKKAFDTVNSADTFTVVVNEGELLATGQDGINIKALEKADHMDALVSAKLDGTGADFAESHNTITDLKYIRVDSNLASIVSYYANGGTGNYSKIYVNGETHTLLKPADIPMTSPSANQRFKHWDVNGDEKQPGDTFVVGNDVVIKAVWEVFCSGAHTYDAGRVAIKPTCGDTGLKVYTCTICEEAKTEPIAKLLDHTFDAGVITTQATETAPGVKTYTCTVCGFKKTEDVAYVPGTPTLTEDELQVSNKLGLTPQGTKDILSYAEEKGISKNTLYLTEDAITKSKKEELSGATFGPLQGRVTKTTKNSITLTWKKVSGANGYIIYGNKCGTKNKYKKITTLSAKKTSYVSKKMNKKKLAKGTYYKYTVVAYKLVDGKKITIAASKTLHAATTGGKYGNAKSVKLKNVKKDKVTIKRKKTFTIKASEVKKDKKIKIHRKLAYETSNKAIATVSSKGKITAKKKGTCYVYVYAQNGMYKRIKVTVK